MHMSKLTTCAVAALLCGPLLADDLPLTARLEHAMFGAHRAAENVERNRYRHPVGTLTFFGLEEGMKVLEIWPGAGWYTEILAPALRDRGQYVAASYDPAVSGQPDYRYQLHEALLAKLASVPELYDQVQVVTWSPPASTSLGEPGSYDMILTFRNTHGWVSEGIAASVFAEFARVLKPGGVLGVVQHRAAPGADPAISAESGYLSEAAVIDLARAAGLYLDGRAEINANPADNRDHPEGVWSLPPNLAVCAPMTAADAKAACEAEYRAIGESDRMTLRFRKPVG